MPLRCLEGTFENTPADLVRKKLGIDDSPPGQARRTVSSHADRAVSSHNDCSRAHVLPPGTASCVLIAGVGRCGRADLATAESSHLGTQWSPSHAAGTGALPVAQMRSRKRPVLPGARAGRGYTNGVRLSGVASARRDRRHDPRRAAQRQAADTPRTQDCLDDAAWLASPGQLRRRCRRSTVLRSVDVGCPRPRATSPKV
jgi:hypothetical protein